MRRGVVVAVTVGAFALCVGASSAQALEGTAVMAAKQKIAVKRCGKDGGTSGLTFTVDASGAWTAETSEGGTFTGTGTPFGASGRKLDLTFDAGSLTAFAGSLASDASSLCGAAVIVETAERTLFRFGVNRRGTKAGLVLKYRFAGSAGGQPGTATFKLKASGPFTQP
jgi:hypothetical protein